MRVVCTFPSTLKKPEALPKSQLMVQRFKTLIKFFDNALRLVQANDAVAQGLVQMSGLTLMKPEPLRSQLMVRRCKTLVKCF